MMKERNKKMKKIERKEKENKKVKGRKNKNKKKIKRCTDRELNPGLPRGRREFYH